MSYPSGLISVEQLPRSGAAATRLGAAVKRAALLRAAVAFWSVRPKDVTPDLLELLRRNGSFLCVDLQLPTSIDRLVDLSSNGVDVRICLARVRARQPGRMRGEFRGLMHAKLLLFERENGTAEIWTGSHNWTLSALHGLNFEASAIVEAERRHPFFSQTEDLLRTAKRLCEKFDVKSVDYYKALQGEQIPTKRVLTVWRRRVTRLGGQGLLLLLGSGYRDERLPGPETQVILRAIDLDKNSEQRLFETTVIQSGRLKKSHYNAGQVSFSGNLWASGDRGSRIIVGQGQTPPSAVVSDAFSFLTLDLKQAMPSRTEARDQLPTSGIWTKAGRDWLRTRMGFDTAPDSFVQSETAIEVPDFNAADFGRKLMEPGQVTEDLFSRMRIVVIDR